MLNCWVLSSVWLFSVGAFLHFKQRFSRLSAKLIAPCQHWATWIVFKTRKLTTADHSCPQLDLLLANENETLLVSKTYLSLSALIYMDCFQKLTTADQMDLLLTNEMSVKLLVLSALRLFSKQESFQLLRILTKVAHRWVCFWPLTTTNLLFSQSTNTLDNMVVKLWHSYHEQFYTNMFFQNICQIRQHVLIYS